MAIYDAHILEFSALSKLVIFRFHSVRIYTDIMLTYCFVSFYSVCLFALYHTSFTLNTITTHGYTCTKCDGVKTAWDNASKHLHDFACVASASAAVVLFRMVKHWIAAVDNRLSWTKHTKLFQLIHCVLQFNCSSLFISIQAICWSVCLGVFWRAKWNV